MVGYMYGPKQAAVMPGIMQRPVQKILNNHQYQPIKYSIGNLKQKREQKSSLNEINQAKEIREQFSKMQLYSLTASTN